ncbi:leucine-responsive regulatory protein [Tatumella ptyseos ATCC 33301]|uniref:Leucine-responsive regulatory protein n=3 Tax=Tatumella TaxID=82986 RepID=A0A085JFB7_9GAMM|nr:MULTISPECIES: Lrp/AsnC ligand binding domain-containing protein [Tatumella]KFD19163.1 leucine-responsive regulatory protein [Tatumella ptyseos ATCC 33301]SQK75295.1 Leucine-responsive regulatory protein [Tatumella ptyseos]
MSELPDNDKSLDRFDIAILKILQQDSSVSNVVLAGKINLSPPACLRRVERLKQNGFITRHVAILNPQALKAGLVVMIGVVLDRSTPETFNDFEDAVRNIRGCMECHMVSGEFDYIMLIRTADNQSFNKLHAEQLLFLPGVRQIRSFIGLREVFSTTQIPL